MSQRGIAPIRFERDEAKNSQNLLKHDIRFGTAMLVFEDPFALTQGDPFSEDEERWVTLGIINHTSLLFVVHT